MLRKMIVPALLLISSASFAQTKFGAEVGLNMYKQSILINDASQSTSFLPGFKVGAVADMSLSENISVQPGVFYKMNRSKMTMGFAGLATADVTRTVHELQVPIYFMYKTGMEGSGRFFAGVGPSFSFALSGNDHISGTVLGAAFNDDQKVKFGSDAGDDMKPFNVAGSVTLGYELPMGVYIRGNYDYGFLNMLPKGDSKNSIKDMSFGLSVGYFF